MNKTLLLSIIIFLLTGCDLVQSSRPPKRKDSYFSKTLVSQESPNGQRKVEVGYRRIDSANWMTQAIIDFGKCGGSIYTVKGQHPDINAYWKGNDTIIVETQSEYEHSQKYEWMVCYSEKLRIIYIEK
jgi:hypothetical protein